MKFSSSSSTSSTNTTTAEFHSFIHPVSQSEDLDQKKKKMKIILANNNTILSHNQMKTMNE